MKCSSRVGSLLVDAMVTSQLSYHTDGKVAALQCLALTPFLESLLGYRFELIRETLPVHTDRSTSDEVGVLQV